ncbi:hypothetical protein AH04_95 [Erwinia phage AH04]|uniref:Uncharacterized protein n=1 Tax=Erwinia phage AH04 TaxID=2869569 RepID=A0AAE7X0U6_9CAUD|nr:hypothetical protein PQC02_gp219 [Erwinia phage AH04]QZA70578.1 hypothetical protein AH04_95 [Erwinia phage AH04]
MSEEKTELEKGIQKEVAMNVLRASVIGKHDESFDPAILPIFVGALGETHRSIYKTAVTYTALQRALSDEEVGRGSPEGRDSKALKLSFDELVNEHFPDIEEDELVAMLINYMSFIYKGVDRLLLRDENAEIILREGLSNTVAGKDNTRVGTISPVKPSNDKTLSPRDRMRRNLRGGRGEPDTFNIILLNSLIFLRVEIPSAPDLIRLINTIATRLQTYGERYNVSALHLERAGISEILIDFVLDRLKYHSVKDVSDHYELKQYILQNDLNPIVMGLLCTTAPKGVSFRMYCVANKCQHSEVQIVDPTTMVLDVEDDMPEERRALLYDIVNKGRKLSREELWANRPVYKDQDGKELDDSIPIENIGRYKIQIPYLDEYFSTFRAMCDRINPDLRQLAMDFPNVEDFKRKRKDYMSGIRGSEYIQWIGSVEYDPEAGTEGEVEIIKREEDPRSFEQGLLDNFSDDEELYMDVLQKLIRFIPRMTYTYVGIPNDACPACNKSADSVDRELTKGFTPIDPIMNFFDRTRMMIGMRETAASSIEENLS